MNVAVIARALFKGKGCSWWMEVHVTHGKMPPLQLHYRQAELKKDSLGRFKGYTFMNASSAQAFQLSPFLLHWSRGSLNPCKPIFLGEGNAGGEVGKPCCVSFCAQLPLAGLLGQISPSVWNRCSGSFIYGCNFKSFVLDVISFNLKWDILQSKSN